MVVVPLSWTENAHAVFGVRPQQSLNAQIVDHADLVLALFAGRLGSPTGVADSGTVEEIERLLEAGKPVSVLRSAAPGVIAGLAAAKERVRLEEWISTVFAGKRGLIFSYANPAELSGLLENLLSAQAEEFLAVGSQMSAAVDSVPSDRGVWPRVESRDELIQDSDGAFRPARKWWLILENKGPGIARDVWFRFENPDGSQATAFDAKYARLELEIMPAGAVERFELRVTFQQAGQAICVVAWRDDVGSHSSRATVRTL